MEAITQFTLSLADTALVLGHRNSEWCGHGPVLEQDIAISNIALDLIGQARNFYDYAAEQLGGSATEDSLAYLRDPKDFLNLTLAEQPKGDWAFTVARQFLVGLYQYHLYTALLNSPDTRLAGIAEKSIKEVTYHVRWSSEWVIRLGDGTKESHRRMQDAMDDCLALTGEFFTASAYEVEMGESGICPLPESLRGAWENRVDDILREATLAGNDRRETTGGKNGDHGPHLQALLSEMQSLHRAHPNVTW